jgi:hypothetical protein
LIVAGFVFLATAPWGIGMRMKAGTTLRQGLIFGLAGVEAGAMLASGAARHAGWWIEWHTRHGAAARLHKDPAGQAQQAAMRLMRAA